MTASQEVDRNALTATKARSNQKMEVFEGYRVYAGPRGGSELYTKRLKNGD
jgi:hypothetical protein